MENIVQVVQHLRPGGIETMSLELKRINLNNSRIFIISLEGNKKDAIKAWPKLKEIEDDLIFLNKKNGMDYGLLLRLIKVLHKIKPIAVHTHHIGPMIYAGLAARLVSVPRIIHTEHDAWHLNNRKRRVVERCILSIVKPKLVADAYAVAKDMYRHLKVKKISVIHNGIDTTRFVPGDKKAARDKLGISNVLPEGHVLIGCSGRMVMVKGHRTLIDSMRRLPKHVHIVFAGKGRLEATLRSQVKSLGFEHRIHFLGHVDDMPTFYQALDIFCLPSLREGMPLAPLEAQSCGIPAVLSDTGGTSEALCSLVGELACPGNYQSLSDALNKVIGKKYSSPYSSRVFVTENRNVIKMAQSYEHLYGFTQGEVA